MLGRLRCSSRRTTVRRTDPEAVRVRQLVVDAVCRNPLAEVSDPEVLARLADGEDVSFDELGLDSLARLTIAVDLDEHGFAISEVEVSKAGTVDGLVTALLALH
jgi:acyl carrier protein